MSFAGRTALVTGAASGIGKAVAEWLDAQGIGEIVAVDIDSEGLDALDLSCRLRRVSGDVADPALWDRIEADLDRLDHAHVNAGIVGGGALTAMDFADWRKVLSVNLDGAFLALRTSLRVMQRSGNGGSIVVTSSAAGIKPVPGSAAYSASKAAVAHLARVAAAEHTRDNIRVNAVAPGRVETAIWTDTEGFRQLEKDLGSRKAALAHLSKKSWPPGDFTNADVIAGQIGFLLSDAAENITGTVLVSDDGYTL
jgi:NAD(P)-dependent dehydrogenase (short-subunit alcohol dehydrogenase family)